MIIDPLLRAGLEPVAARQRRLRFWSVLASCWASAALLGLAVVAIQRSSGFGSALSLPLIALAGLSAACFGLFRLNRIQTDWRQLSRLVEERHPDLECLLLTAAQQTGDASKPLNYLQDRLVREALLHSKLNQWPEAFPRSRVRVAFLAHWLALALFAIVLWELRLTGGTHLLARVHDTTLTVTPGDASIERGGNLVVLARFTGPLPAKVQLVVEPAPGASERLPLVKSLSDPMFGASVPDLQSNLVYRVEFDGRKSPDFRVTVFEYPRLERADALVTFPEYTGQPPKQIENTRRLSAVEGSTLRMDLKLNKPVVSAKLVPKDGSSPPMDLSLATNQPAATLEHYAFETNQSFQLLLVDFDGRTNKTTTLFTFQAVKNRTPELRIASPRGDVRPSPLEEINFEGTVWDDFGIPAFGLGYTVAGGDTKFIQLGEAVPAREKREFKYVLRLEDLAAEPDQLMSWFLWADDRGPDGELRRTTGDLYFAEVRPFDEIFREGQDGSQQDQSGQGGGGQGQSPATKLADLQKQIISATWRLVRERTAQRPPSPAAPKPSPGSSSLPFPTQASQNFVAAAPLPSNQATGAHHPLSSRGGEGQGEGFFSLPHAPRSNAPRLFSRLISEESPPAVSPGSRRSGRAGTQTPLLDATNDTIVVRDSQAQALDQAEGASQSSQDPRTISLWSSTTKSMEKALDLLNQATNSSASLPDALAAEKSAYQALIKLQQHEYQVMRSRNQNQRGGGSNRQQQLQRQLDQLDFAQSDTRYESQSQARQQQNSARLEQLQVMNRLQELARRQQDLNDRLQELQTALQEAKTEQERQDVQRRLKRLQEEEQQMLADVDEVRQRMDQPENQSRMADQRKQLDQTREDVQKAADAASQGQASQALASGTRAQRQLQQLRDDIRKQNSSEFTDDLREMRAQARELARQQEDLQKKIENPGQDDRRSLSDKVDRDEILQQLEQQKQHLTNLLDRASTLSQQAEDAEPLLASRLYDSVRQFSQDSIHSVKDLQEDLLTRRRLTREVYDKLNQAGEQEGARLFDATSEMLKQGLQAEAGEAAKRAGTGIEQLKKGVERAAESVLGDDTEALRLAQQELDRLANQLQREMTRDEAQTNGQRGMSKYGLGPTNAPASTPGQLADAQNARRNSSQQDRSGQRDGQGQPSEQDGQQNPGSRNGQQGQQASANGQQQQGDPSQQQGGGNQPGQQGQQGRQPGGRQNGGGRQPQDQQGNQQAGGSIQAGGDQNTATGGGGLTRDFEDFVRGDANGGYNGPITGSNYGIWSDGLRDVEEMIDLPDWRNRVAIARDRARLIRQEYRRNHEKPDWANVRLQVMNPLVEVRDLISDELARRQSNEALVPIDRDPVPERYTELVRRYYRDLGKDSTNALAH